MHSNNECIDDVARRDALRSSGAATRSFTWSPGSKIEKRSLDYEALLLAIAGHDLRQPLQAIQSAHELLGLGIRTKSELRLLRSGQRAIDRLTAQLDQLLAALRIRDPNSVKLMPMQLTQVLRKIAQENELDALKKGIKLRAVPSRVCIQSDTLLFSAILRNLVRNAVRYTDPGGGILIGCRSVGDSVRIEVYDTGVGISGDDMPRILEMFTCVDGGSPEGCGVGLYIVQQALAILGHRLEIKSAPRLGSRFCIIAKRA
jgi:two-component system, OmpR family, phosphate regulon sensor histidine kinase PhoR